MVTDASGNTATCSFTVTVMDMQTPVINCPSNIAVNTAAGTCAAIVTYATPAFGDNCPGATIQRTAGLASGSSFPRGVTSIIHVVTDASGNTATCNFTVTVSDKEKPVITSCPVVPIQCYVPNNIYTIPLLTATDNCGVQSITYTVSGATVRNGTGSNASGIFNPGINTISWTVNDINGNISSCNTSVKIDKVDALIPDVYAAGVNSTNGKANTIYIGYGGTSLTLNAQVVSSLPSNTFSYKWTLGSSSGTIIGTSQNITVSPTATTVYVLSIKDINNCKPLLQVTKQINVVNIVCGAGKITVCVPQKIGTNLTSCVSSSTTSLNKLPVGWYLGQCTTATLTLTVANTPAYKNVIPNLEVTVAPNPSMNEFKITIKGNKKEAISLRIVDVLGRTIERKASISIGTLILGGNYRPGAYFIEVIQGDQRRYLKLIKGAQLSGR